LRRRNAASTAFFSLPRLRCHDIPGIRGPASDVGPPLDHIAHRAYIAGVLPNTPENMLRWLMNPPGVDPRTAMPNMGISEEQARDIAAYLATLE
jgi:cytochrome c1